MSTKSSIFYQPRAEDETGFEEEGWIHIYWEPGIHLPEPGIYIDLGCEVVRVKDPEKLRAHLSTFLDRKPVKY